MKKEGESIVASMGSRLSEKQAGILIDYGKPVYVFYDADEAGDLGVFGREDRFGNIRHEGVVHRLSDHLPCLVPEFPEGKDDPDILTREDVDKMKKEAMIT